MRTCEECGVSIEYKKRGRVRFCGSACRAKWVGKLKIQRTAAEVWNKVGPPDSKGCWNWLGHLKSSGYGLFKKRRAHRYIYELVKGPIPAGMELDHLCHNPRCVNPDHLDVVTHRVNSLRSPNAPPAVNSRKTRCPKGHFYTPENTIRHGPDRKWRICKDCARQRRRSPEYKKWYKQWRKDRKARHLLEPAKVIEFKQEVA